MSGLRIALIASNRFPIAQPFAGGLEAHVWQLARGLVAAGHQVTLFAALASDSALGCSELVVRDLRLSEAARSDPAMPALAFMNDHHAYLSLMLELARTDRDRFDIIHNHSLHYLPVAHAAALPTPMICTLHTPPTPWLESAITASGGAGVQFVAVSRHTAGMWSPMVTDISVVPNGIHTDLWPLGSGGGPLVWFGRITPEKGPHLAIDAARQAGRPLVLAGPRSDLDYFDSEVAPRLNERIRYVGHLPHTELAALVGRSAAALVTPMWDEPYGLVVAEALSCGTPVVAFARGGIPEIVDADCGRLVAPGDASAMAAAIAEAVALPRDRVRRHALERCSASTMLARYVTIYHRTIGSQKAKSHARLLHSSQRSGTSRARGQHSDPTAAAGHCADVGPAAPASSLPLGGAAAARRRGPVG
jgi:glycosyltransferase involved in cell wall biosynthesis